VDSMFRGTSVATMPFLADLCYVWIVIGLCPFSSFWAWVVYVHRGLFLGCLLKVKHFTGTHRAGIGKLVAVLFSFCLAGPPQIPSEEHKRGQANGTVSNRERQA
jgi:hypothetical protein